MELAAMKDKELVAKLVTLDNQRSELIKEINRYKAEVLKRGLAVLEDHSNKYYKIYADNGSCAITDTEKLTVTNDNRLKSLLPDGIYDKFVTIVQKTEYKYDSKFEKALKAIFNQDYTFEMSLEEFLDDMNADTKQKKLLLKKLTGDYEKDREVVTAALGEGDYDVELYYINKLKNGELIKRFLPDEGLDYQLDEIKKCMIVESSTKLTIEANDMEE